MVGPEVVLSSIRQVPTAGLGPMRGFHSLLRPATVGLFVVSFLVLAPVCDCISSLNLRHQPVNWAEALVRIAQPAQDPSSVDEAARRQRSRCLPAAS